MMFFMGRHFLSIIAIVALLTQVAMASNPFLVRCQNTGILSLDVSPVHIKNCCKDHAHRPSEEKEAPKIKCCKSVLTSMQALLVERTRESLSKSHKHFLDFVYTPNILPKAFHLLREPLFFSIEPDSPPEGQGTLRSQLGSWTC